MEGGYGSLGNNSGKQEIRPISRKTKVIVLTVIAVSPLGWTKEDEQGDNI